MASYTPQGVGHRALSFVKEGPATYAELARALWPDASPNKRRKAFYVLASMREHGLLHREDLGGYAITEDGRDALAILESGQPYTVHEAPEPNVRIFVKDAA